MENVHVELIVKRIFENQHLLDATEIFRKLNVHKKVPNIKFSLYPISC